MTKIAPSKEDKYESKPIMAKREKIRGAGRLKDTSNDLAAHSLHKLKTKMSHGKIWRRQPGLLRHTKTGILLSTVLPSTKALQSIHRA